LKSFGNFLKKREPWEVVAAKLERSVDAVKMKAKRLGLNVVVEPPPPSTTNDLPEELPSVKEVLKVLARVLKSFDKPGLEMSEIQRLQAVVATIRSYETMLAIFMHYREIEKRVVELEAKYARPAREKA
jgi:hypothetical protein